MNTAVVVNSTRMSGTSNVNYSSEAVQGTTKQKQRADENRNLSPKPDLHTHANVEKNYVI